MVEQRGSAIVLAILVLALLAMIGVALLTLSEDSAKLGRADDRAKQAFYVAEAGLEHARLALYTANGGGSFDGPLETAATDGTIDFDPDALAPIFNADGGLVGFGAGVGDDAPLVAPTSFGDGGTYAVYLSNDAIDGITSPDDTNGRITMTAIGSSRDRTLEVVQAIIETESIWSQAPQAALTIAGPVPVFDPGSGSSTRFSGDDCLGAGEPGYYVPAVGTLGSDPEADVQTQMGGVTYEAGGLSSTGAIADLTDLSEAAVSSVITSEWSDCQQLVDLIEVIRLQADVVCTGPGCTLPPASSSRVVFVDGDWTITDGEGLIVVTGEASIGNHVDWTGAIFVVGEGILRRSGSGSGVLSGGLLIADVAGPDGVFGSADDCGAAGCTEGGWYSGGGDDDDDDDECDDDDDEEGACGPPANPCGFQPATLDTTGTGSPTVSYCASVLDAVEPVQLYRITDFRQR